MRHAEKKSKLQSDTAQRQATAPPVMSSVAEGLHGSPRMVAQRQQLNSLFGAAAQLQGVTTEEELPAQRQAAPDEELLQGRFGTAQRQTASMEEELPAQRQSAPDEDLLQGRFGTVQRQAAPMEDALLQKKDEPAAPNRTGLPDGLKAGVEALSGMDMSEVRVHRNSSEPAQLQALAYAQGNDIHLGPGQEQHLPHEAWHVVQQRQGRVRATVQMAGQAVNDDPALESEADLMGARAAGGVAQAKADGALTQVVSMPSALRPVQRAVPADAAETALADTALDTLLGVGHAARGAVLAAASTIGALQAAVASIAVLAPDAGDRTAIANEVQDAELLDQLVQLADQPGFGTAGRRLRSVLAENAAAARTVLGLTPLIAAKKNLDRKVLEGAQSLDPFVPATLAPGQVATGAGLGLVGGHSDHVLDPATFHAEPTGVAANGARDFSIRKVLRGDAGGYAAAVHANAPNNVLARIVAGEAGARVVAGAVAPVVRPPNYAGLPDVARGFWDARVGHYTTNVAAIGLANAPVAALVLAVGAAATAYATAAPATAAELAAFVDAVRALMTQVDVVIAATRQVANAATVNAAPPVAAYATARQDFLTQGPAMSIAKDSTVPPVAWSDDEVLAAGHQAIQQPARWVETAWTLAAPLPNNTMTQTLHQAVVPHAGGAAVVWNAVKDGVTYTTPPSAYAGGNVLGFWPTVDSALPALPAAGVAVNHWYTAP
jgi:hypothetical protein